MTLTKEDLEAIGNLIEEKLDAKLDVRFQAFEEKLDKKLEEKLEEKLERKLDQKLDQKLNEKLEEKLEPFIKTQQELLKAQVEMNKRLDTMQSQVQNIYFDLQEIKMTM